MRWRQRHSGLPSDLLFVFPMCSMEEHGRCQTKQGIRDVEPEVRVHPVRRSIRRYARAILVSAYLSARRIVGRYHQGRRACIFPLDDRRYRRSIKMVQRNRITPEALRDAFNQIPCEFNEATRSAVLATAEKNLAQLRQHRLEIAFGGFWIEIVKDRPLLQVVNVLVTNKTDHRLDDCRLQLEIITRVGIERPAWARFPFCEPFSLLVDETKRKTVAEYCFDEASPNLFVRLFDEIDNRWVRREGGLVLTSGDYELCVEGLSSHTPMAHFTLRAKCESGRWAIGPM
jgi:hypothetical protein